MISTVLSVLYHTLQEADSLETYIEDAKQRGDEDLAGFFEEIKEEFVGVPSEQSRCLPNVFLK